ncbi:hypothetical protein SEA_HONK_34 [Microbacterium phage Honk]|uniref:Uncharacterized protein n=1 Tax=Microbacterium phage Honk TaxID=2836095 RepID=A0A8F3E6W1_9CAUD|nr:hypothetical protein SEA_HONK_34 [Microbacterium phage Honk]
MTYRELLTPEEVAEELGYDRDDYKRPGFMAELLDRLDNDDI